MAGFNSNEDFDDIQKQLQYVRSSLGWKTDAMERDYGCSRRGDGWSSPFYYIYCNHCQMEIEKAWIDPDDEQKLERCPECKKHKDLCTKKQRKQELQERIDEFVKEEETMKKHIRKWKIYRKKFPLKLVLNNESVNTQFIDQILSINNENVAEYSDESDQDSDVCDAADSSLHLLQYDENCQWISTGIDIQSYVINKWYIPDQIAGLKDRAKGIYEKYKIIDKQRHLAMQQKELGNACNKKADFAQAIKHYTDSILHRTDFKAAYTNRALMYFKLGEYDKCILDCTLIIEMIKIVYDDDKQQLLSTEMFKAYLRRSNALKLQLKNRYILAAKCDVDNALKIRKNDGAAKKLLSEINMELETNKLRQELQNIDNEQGLQDFDCVLDETVKFLEESTLNDVALESRESEELLRRLYVFMCKNKKYCVRFVDKNGLILCLKYLQKKFRKLKTLKDKKEKMNDFIGPFSLLNSCCQQTVNLKEFKKAKYLRFARIIIVNTMCYYAEMNEELKVQSMRFISLIISVGNICDNIAAKCGSKMMRYFVTFQNKTNAFTQNTNAIRHLFEVFSQLFQCKIFRIYLYEQINPYLYEIFLHSMFRYNGFIKKKTNNDNISDCENIQYGISVLLDGLGLIFDADACLGRTGYNDDDEKLQNQTKTMILHFVNNKNIDTYLHLITQYLKDEYLKLKQLKNGYISKEQRSKPSIFQTNCNKKEIEFVFSQIVRCLNVLVQVSDPLYDKLVHRKLYEFEISEEIILLMLYIGKNPDIQRAKMRKMLKLAKYKILTYLDHMSDNKQFDGMFGCIGFDQNELNKNINVLPYFWKFIMDVVGEQYKEKQITPKLMEEFSMNKSRCIRIVYRWMNRCNDCNNKSFIFELIIKEYFKNNLLEWLSYSDQQIMANMPLVITQIIKYSIKQNTKKKLIKKYLNVKVLKVILNLMRTKHRVIQYNAMLLMANIIDFDQEIATLCHVIGAAALLRAYKKNRCNNNKQIKM